MDGLTISNVNNKVSDIGEGRAQRNQNRKDLLNFNGGAQKSGESFTDTLSKAITEVDQLQKTADVKMQKISTGQSQDIHGTMIATEKADIALRLMVQVRNKIIDAYQEIMKMQV